MSESEKSAERVNDICNKLRQIGERFKNRITLPNLRLVDRYLENELHILVEYRVGPVFEEYVASFQAIQGARSSEIEIGGESHVADSGATITSNDGGRQVHWPMPKCDGEQQAVLVDVVQLVEHPEWVAVPSLVRLNRLDRFYDVWPRALYLSSQIGTVFRGVLRDRKVNIFSLPIAARSNPQLHGDVVQGAAQIEQDISSDGPNLCRDFSERPHIKELVPFVIALGADFAWAGLFEGRDRDCEITDVLIGPFEFQSGT